jgi:hypothetical protein
MMLVDSVTEVTPPPPHLQWLSFIWKRRSPHSSACHQAEALQSSLVIMMV